MHTQNSWNNGSSFGLVISCNAQYPNPTNSGECEITTDHIWTLCVLKIFKNLLIAHPSGSKRNCTHKNLKSQMNLFSTTASLLSLKQNKEFTWSAPDPCGDNWMSKAVRVCLGSPSYMENATLNLNEWNANCFWYELQVCKLRIITPAWKKYCPLSVCRHQSEEEPHGITRQFYSSK